MTPFNKSGLKRGQLIFLWTTLVLRKAIKVLSRQAVKKVWNGEEKTAKAHIVGGGGGEKKKKRGKKFWGEQKGEFLCLPPVL